MPLKSDFRQALQNLTNVKRKRITDAFATAYGYQATIPDPANAGQTIPNPQSETQFTAERIVAFINDIVAGTEIEAKRRAVVADPFNPEQ